MKFIQLVAFMILRFFFKQWGRPATKKSDRARDLDGRTWEEFPFKFLQADAVL